MGDLTGARAHGLDRALVALVAGLALLAIACVGAVWLTGEQEKSAAWVNHSLEVENRISAVLSMLQDAETGQRGYLLTRQPEFLKPYQAASAGSPPGRPRANAPLRPAVRPAPVAADCPLSPA